MTKLFNFGGVADLTIVHHCSQESLVTNEFCLNSTYILI